ncbi:histidine phosphatase family protein [Brachybacterium hainanense]|uniref:Histidine phosphatase family protein n=1 Tax=Brachybacterium hainanense TaxID=1541174 RepID=A0ABV6RGL5_9MICO
MSRVLVLRHGESTANVAGIIVSRPGPRALVEVGLTDRGREQARAAAEASGLGADAILVTSDFARAAETAREFADVLGAAEPIIDRRLRERSFGIFEEGPAAAYAQVWAADAAGEHPGDGVETTLDVAARALAALADARASAQSSGGAPVVLVAHGDVLQILLTVAAGEPARSHRSQPHLGNAELREIPAARPGA